MPSAFSPKPKPSVTNQPAATSTAAHVTADTTTLPLLRGPGCDLSSAGSGPGVAGSGRAATGAAAAGVAALGARAGSGAGAGGRGVTLAGPAFAGPPSTSRSMASAVAASRRSSGSLRSSPWMTGARGPAYRGTGLGVRRMLSWTSQTSLPPNGRRPSTISYSVTPSAHRSDAGVGPREPGAKSSGARYGGVPMMLPGRVTEAAPTNVAMPKSTRITSPSSRTSTLPGFTSRWTTDAACTARRPRRIWWPMSAALGTASTCWLRNRSASDPASSSFITIQTCLSVSTWSWTVTMFGCSILAIASASRRARYIAAVWVSAVIAFRSSRPLMATNRRRRRSWAFHTSPMPPLPIGSSSS